jgi:hypothetical protein
LAVGVFNGNALSGAANVGSISYDDLLLFTVPEPAMAALVVVGIGLACGRRVRRGRRS